MSGQEREKTKQTYQADITNIKQHTAKTTITKTGNFGEFSGFFAQTRKRPWAVFGQLFGSFWAKRATFGQLSVSVWSVRKKVVCTFSVAPVQGESAKASWRRAHPTDTQRLNNNS